MRSAPLPQAEEMMPKPTLPKTESIQKLAKFWDTHDLTDFDDQLEEVPEPVFVRRSIQVPLNAAEARALDDLAQAKGVSRETLLRKWVTQHLARRKKRRATKRAS
jgi:hypothetical protein